MSGLLERLIGRHPKSAPEVLPQPDHVDISAIIEPATGEKKAEEKPIAPSGCFTIAPADF